MIDRYNKRIILFPQKTGSTSFSKYLQMKQDHSYIPYIPPLPQLNNLDDLGRAPGNESGGRLSQHKNIRIYERNLNLEGWKIYQTARHPVTRFVSGFSHHCRVHVIDISESRELAIRYLDNIPILQATNDAALFTEITGIYELEIKHAQDILRSRDNMKTVDECRALLKSLTERFSEAMKRQDFPPDYSANLHNTLFTPQNIWADVRKYDVTYLKLEEDNTQIYEEMGLNNFKLPQINTFMSPVEAILDPSHPRAKGTSVENYKNLLEDRDLVKRVEETYSKDLEILGYDSLL